MSALALSGLPALLLGLLLQLPPADQALIGASLAGDREAITTALSQGARLEVRHTDRGLTPLMLAIYRDHGPAVDALIAAGADVNARNLRGHTPLIMAAAGGQLAMVKQLMQAGAQRDAIEEIGNTALMWAAFWGHLQVVDWLLASGADVSQHNRDGNDALLLAAQGGVGPRSRELVVPKAPLTPAGRLLSDQFASSEEVRLIERLLQAGADVNSRNYTGQSALMLFAGHGKSAAVRRLLTHGAQLLARDREGRNASDYAEQAGYRSLAVWLRRQARESTKF
ncbi:MAG: ankyrin repeat domain-containing protein [Candidatus Sericytochromatia bacterium]|nr:ankyrin repeat domain-containing protein [Candidatus Sericytochromatia bacterium]